MKDFAAIDFETANFKRSSVCSVGVVAYRNGVKVDEFYSLIKPEPECYNDVCNSVNGMCYKIAEKCGYDLKNHHYALAEADTCAAIALKIL